MVVPMSALLMGAGIGILVALRPGADRPTMAGQVKGGLTDPGDETTAMTSRRAGLVPPWRCRSPSS